MESSSGRASRDYLAEDRRHLRLRTLPMRLQSMEARSKAPQSLSSAPMAPSSLRSDRQLSIILQPLHSVHLQPRSPRNPKSKHPRLVQRLVLDVRQNPKRLPLQPSHPIPNPPPSDHQNAAKLRLAIWKGRRLLHRQFDSRSTVFEVDGVLL